MLGLGDQTHHPNGGSSLLSARKHFAQALELQPASNLRALFGLLTTCAALSRSKHLPAAEADMNAALSDFARAAVQRAYGEGALRALAEGAVAELS